MGELLPWLLSVLSIAGSQATAPKMGDVTPIAPASAYSEAGRLPSLNAVPKPKMLGQMRRSEQPAFTVRTSGGPPRHLLSVGGTPLAGCRIGGGAFAATFAVRMTNAFGPNCRRMPIVV